MVSSCATIVATAFVDKREGATVTFGCSPTTSACNKETL